MPLVAAYFKNASGVPTGGLSATIDILDGDNPGAALIVSGASMTASTTMPGAYVYDFDTAAGWTSSLRWIGEADFGAAQGANRYQPVFPLSPTNESGESAFVDDDGLQNDAITAAKIANAAIDAATFAAGAIDAAAIATDAIDADAIAADAIGSSELATSAVNEIRDAILSDSTPFNGADIAAILLDTGTTIPGLIAALNDLSSTDVENAVWDSVLASHVTANTAGRSQVIARYEGFDGLPAVHIDTVGGAAGTTLGVNGTPDNPSNSWANALTIANALGLESFVLHSNLTLTSAAVGKLFIAKQGGGTLDPGGFDVGSSIFRNVDLTGTIVTTSGALFGFETSLLGPTSGFVGVLVRPGLSGTITLGTGTTTFAQAASIVPGTSTPIIDLNGVANFNLRGYSGGIEVRGSSAGGQNSSLEFVAGQLVLDASNTAGTIAVRGMIGRAGATNFVDNSAGATINIDGTVHEIVEDRLANDHGSGQWDGTDSDWTSGEREQIRFRLAMDGTQTDPTTGAGTIEDILADTDSLDTTKITTARANNLDEITAARLSELDAANIPADIDLLIANMIAASGTIAAGSTSTVVNSTIVLAANDRPNNMQVLIEDATGFMVARNINDYATASGAFTVDDLGFTPGTGDLIVVLARTGSVPVTVLTAQQIRDAMKLSPTGGAPDAGSVDEHLDDILANTADAGGKIKQGYTFDQGTNTFIINASLEDDLGERDSGIADATCELFDSAGTSVAGPAADGTADSEGVFRFTLAAPTLAIGENAFYSLVTIDDSTKTPTRTVRGITKITVVRTV